jgi:hypothetical protein
MKNLFKTFILILTCWMTNLSFAQQVPQAINYQAIARNSQGAVFVNQALVLRISILSQSTTGEILYQETHEVTTNNFGLFTVKIGQGTPTIGQFSSIQWSDANQLMKVEMNFNNSGFVEIGNNELLSVPYAFYAENSGNSSGTSNTILNGTALPNENIGNEGDFYINISTNQIFGPKTNNNWGQGTSLVGPQGPPGQGGGGTGNGGLLVIPILTTSFTSSATNFAYNQYYGNFPISATIYNELLSTYSGTSLQIKLVAIGTIGGGSINTTCNVRIQEYFTGSVFGSWSNAYTFSTDNIAIETPWTTLNPIQGHRGLRFEINNTGGNPFTLYNAAFYIRTQ